MSSLAGTGSKAESKGKVPGNTIGITKQLLKEQLRQSKAVFGVQQPIRKTLGAQTMEALKTGGVGARIPIIQRAVDAAQQANARALSATEAGLTAGNLAGTPFGQSILAQQRQAGRQAAAQIPTSFAQALIEGAGGGGGAPQMSIPGAVAPGGGGGGLESGFGAFLSSLALRSKFFGGQGGLFGRGGTSGPVGGTGGIG